MRDRSVRLVVVADDFGRSSGVNRAIAAAHHDGIVTGASLMAGGGAFEEAVALAHEHRGLAVGLHVTLCDGRAVLPHTEAPDLVRPDGFLEPGPARAGFRYGLRRRRLLPQIRREVAAQFDRAAAARIDLKHVDGHHHLHIHPWIFPVVCGEAARRGVRWIRIPRGERREGRLGERAVFGILARTNAHAAARAGLRFAPRVHGLARTGRLDEAWLLDLLPRLTPGLHELFAHPDLDTLAGARELSALTSSHVRDRVKQLGIDLVSYAALEPAEAAASRSAAP